MNVTTIGQLTNDVMKSNILKPIVVKKISNIFVDSGVKDDRDEGTSRDNLEASIAGVSDWTIELSNIQEMININEDTMDDVASGEEMN